jgi:cation diffusion facilitator family transporter
VAEGCCGQAVNFDGQSKGYRRILWVVIALNAAMFAVEIVAGALAGSQALLADALDFAGDTATYAMSLFVIGLPLVWRSRAALVKSASLALMGLFVLGSTLYQTFVLAQPNETVMGTVGALALATNVGAALLLMRYKDGDANVRSVWLCSRNDAIGNVAVMLAAVAVAVTGSAWPDLIVAFAMASLFLRSSWQIFQQSLGELRQGESLQAAE